MSKKRIDENLINTVSAKLGVDVFPLLDPLPFIMVF